MHTCPLPSPLCSPPIESPSPSLRTLYPLPPADTYAATTAAPIIASTIPITPPTSSLPAAALELDAAAFAELTLAEADRELELELLVEDAEEEEEETGGGAVAKVEEARTTGTPPDATPAAADADGEVELEDGIDAAPEPPTTAPIPH